MGCLSIQATTIKSPMLPAALKAAINNIKIIREGDTNRVSTINTVVNIKNGDTPTRMYCNLGKYHSGAAAKA